MARPAGRDAADAGLSRAGSAPVDRELVVLSLAAVQWALTAAMLVPAFFLPGPPVPRPVAATGGSGQQPPGGPA